MIEPENQKKSNKLEDLDERGETNLRPRGRLRSQKLDRTLVELESAFNQWDSLPLAKPANVGTKPVESQADLELKQRTRKLLSQLRKQLEDL